MLKIAICDDDITIVEQIRQYLEDAARKTNRYLDIVEFYSGVTLVEATSEKGRFDIIYLDIEMDIMNGINTALKIREKDINVLLIYVSSHEGYYQQLFDVEPFRFIKKPVDKQNFQDIFFKAARRLDMKVRDFHFQYNKSIVKIPLKEIMYFVSERRTINIHTEDKIYTYYDKLDSVEDTVKNEGIVFIRVHKSYLVNYQYIKQWEYTQVTLYNGYTIQISEERRKKIRRIYMELLGKI